MAKILILTASTGGGHDKAAENLRILLEKNGITVQVSSFMKEINRSLDYLVVNSYKQMSLKSPRTFGHLYYISNRKLINNRVSSVFNIVGKTRLLNHINRFEPDVIIGTHLLANNIICKLKANHQISIPYISVVTDFHVHRSYINPEVNAYIVGSAFTKNALVQNGIRSSIVYNYGIPLTPPYYALSKPADKIFTLLIMSGSIGLTFVDELLETLKQYPKPIHCKVVCGNNLKLKRSIEKRYQSEIESGLYEIFGFADHVHTLMETSNVILTKPGGLTTTEAIAKGLPLLIPFAMPGQETENTDFLLSTGAAFKIESGQKLTFILDQLINDPAYYDQVRKNVFALKDSFSLDSTLELIKSFLSPYPVGV
ncbi:glycosyltransferase [Fusibacter sp. 3D3]|uniref:MGDG synthase family glycosyltransferase n=1 Tax=Fusibacter sp. 3D3 TaxID=1048380 RepID=UPI000852A105|nr:glycosyltransferase [Fusibacter sp. 3D3]GAU77632.1 monogalactosyldiacylglycerol synthase precursor [Fusibacter sp. 3D3]